LGLQRNLRDGDLRDKTIYWSGATDPYASKPAVSRAVWETLAAAPCELRPRRIAVQTRYMAGRDAESMAAYSASSRPSDGGPAVVVSYSIGTDRNDLIRAWEAATPSFEQRMTTVERLCRARLPVVVTLSPMALWNDLRTAVERFQALGALYLTCLFFKENVRGASTPKRFLKYLRREYPMLLDPAWQQQQVQTMRAVFGEPGVLVGQAGFTSLACPQNVTSKESPETSSPGR
jgi:DNA repair photolyase